MIAGWSCYIKHRGWEYFGFLPSTEFPTRRSAEAYMKDYAFGVAVSQELESAPSIEVVPDLRSEEQ